MFLDCSGAGPNGKRQSRPTPAASSKAFTSTPISRRANGSGAAASMAGVRRAIGPRSSSRSLGSKGSRSAWPAPTCGHNFRAGCTWERPRPSQGMPALNHAMRCRRQPMVRFSNFRLFNGRSRKNGRSLDRRELQTQRCRATRHPLPRREPRRTRRRNDDHQSVRSHGHSRVHGRWIVARNRRRQTRICRRIFRANSARRHRLHFRGAPEFNLLKIMV
jgi:hypothetical protein